MYYRKITPFLAPLTINSILEAQKPFVKTPITSKASLLTSNHKQRKTHKNCITNNNFNDVILDDAN
jgi:hypothetical protein